MVMIIRFYLQHPSPIKKKISDFSLKNKIGITKIGTMTDNKHKSIILDGAGRRISLKNKGYFHTFWPS